MLRQVIPLTVVCVMLLVTVLAGCSGDPSPTSTAVAAPEATAAPTTVATSPSTSEAPVAPTTVPAAAEEAGSEEGEGAPTTTIPTTTVVSLEMMGIAPMTSIGQTARPSLTANMSDGSQSLVDVGFAEWESSDPAVVTVTDGTVTAVAGGNAVVTATYEKKSVEALVSVRIAVEEPGTVRMLYAVPKDREFRSDYSEFVQNAVVDLQSWYRRQLGGLTFKLYSATPEQCQLNENAEYYGRYGWERVFDGMQHCAPVEGGTSTHDWVVFVDVDPACTADGRVGDWEDGFDQLYRGGVGLAILNVSSQAEGFESLMAGEDYEWFYCDEGPWPGSLGGAIGGVGHELGHTWWLAHPPGCDEGLPSCDFGAIMAYGFESYPNAYLRAEEKEVLERSPYFARDAGPVLELSGTEGISAVRGEVVGPDGASVENVRISAVSDTLWGWSESGPDGVFEIYLPQGSSGSAVLSILSDLENCGWVGYYSADGLTSRRDEATLVEIGDTDRVHIRLPSHLEDLCYGQRTVTGTVVGPDGNPAEGVWVAFEASWQWGLSEPDGAFEILLPEGSSSSSVLRIELTGLANCEWVGYYGPGEFTTFWEEGTKVEVGRVGVTGIEIMLPSDPDELCRQQNTE